MAGREGGSRLAAPFTLSALLHAAIATLLFNTLKERKPVALPPMYRVEIVAAPPGERAIGEVKTSQDKAATPVTQPTATQSSVKELPLPTAKPAPKTPARATPTEGKVTPSQKVAPTTEAKVTPAPKTATRVSKRPEAVRLLRTPRATIRNHKINEKPAESQTAYQIHKWPGSALKGKPRPCTVVKESRSAASNRRGLIGNAFIFVVSYMPQLRSRKQAG